ncbi:DUF6090 family protein [Gramella sp. GC03-9]|uniref:DUF6090 family protein n=1 Tax=Christiangramia oceanisediminis TaxID=2920386 RepID=A0A9X2I2F9_9FLAO|nr:DUF6090 family protein [Gramella oceanisediminis]MCP9198595.1 DUF6090 family protein [Gramella oceanisediminis]
MIKFFRNIRRRLLRENRFTRYLIYAVGEIILVVIGILIALQINNWNENQQDRKLERGLMTDMITDLRNDLSLLDEVIDRNQIKTERLDSLLTYSQKVNDLDNQNVLYKLSLLSLLNKTTFQNQNRTLSRLPNLEKSVIREQVADSLAAFLMSLEDLGIQTQVYDKVYWEALNLQNKLFHNYLFFEKEYFDDGKETGKKFPRISTDTALQLEYFNKIHLFNGVVQTYISEDYLEGHLKRTEALVKFLEYTYYSEHD